MRRLLFLLTPLFLQAAIEYDTHFVGLDNQSVLRSMRDASDLVALEERPPASLNGLRYRILADVPALLKVLRAYGYYDAEITPSIDTALARVQVTLEIETGPQYVLSSYEVFRGSECKEATSFTPEELGLRLGKPALSVFIVNAELNLLTELARRGYPLASVEKRRVEVDMASKTVRAAACVREGPLSKFGPTSVFGLETVKPRYVLRRIGWREGAVYNPDTLEATQKRLLNSDLFSSVMISHAGELDAHGELPMRMQLTEAKHRQLSIGFFYATVDGPGMSFAWNHRNLRGMGESVSLNGNFSQRYLAGQLVYKKPDFLGIDQTYRALGEIAREDIHAYTAFTYRFANFFEKKFDAQRYFSMGLEGERIVVSDSASNGTYALLGLPLFARYNRADDLLNPTKGYTIAYQAIPFQSVLHSNQHFFKQRFTTTFYLPVRDKRIIFAGRVQFGSIAGAARENVPLPLLFLGGSEDDLRGYRYLTVSPLGGHHKPLGGRSAIFLTAETRIRCTETIGLVPFADFGTVTFNPLPQFDAKWFKSVGVGFRYFTFFGPLRADIGFPLDRRKALDPPFRIYASIGQTF